MEAEQVRAPGMPREAMAGMPVEARSINALMAACARRWGAATALRGIDERTGAGAMTYAGLAQQHFELVALLERRGIARGDRVAGLLPGGPEAVTAMLAIGGAATYVPVAVQTHPLEIETFLRRLHVRAAVVAADTPAGARQAATRAGAALIELHNDGISGEAGKIALHFPADMTLVRPKPPANGGSHAEVFALLQTSGTTARSKIVPLTHAQLLGATSQNVALLQLTPRDRCLHVLAPVHMMGITTVLYTLMSGGELVVGRRFHSALFFEWARDAEPTWITGPPAIHQGIVRYRAGHEQWAAHAGLRFLRTGAAPMPAPLMEQIERLWQAPVIEAYAMSECPLITSNRVGAGGRRVGSVGRACGVELALVSDEGKIVPARPGRVGEIAIRGATVMRAYADDDAAAHAAGWVDGYFRTGDVGRLDEDGFLYVVGRRKEMINRGGVKIAPREVEEVVEEWPGIAEVAAFAVPHATLGEEVGLAAVMKPGAAADELTLRKFAAERLSAHKVPAHIVFVDEIPKGRTGKLMRAGLAEKLGLADPPRVASPRAYAAPRSGLEAALAVIWQRVLALKEPMGIDEPFLEVGGDSAQAAAMFLEVERLLGRELPLATLVSAPTIRLLAEAMGREGVGKVMGCLVRLQPGDGQDRCPLFCFSGMLGHVLNFYPLARALGDDQPVYALQMPDAAGQSFSRDVGFLARKFLREMRSVQQTGPWQLLGYSYGGFVAYAVAQLLRQEGEEVSFLGMLDTRSPACRKRALAPYVMAYRARRLGRRLLGLQKRQEPRGAPATAEQRAMERASVEAVRAYPMARYGAPMVVLRAREQPWWVRWEGCDWALGWDKFAAQVEVKKIDGAHATVLEARHAAELAAVLRGCLQADAAFMAAAI